MHRHYYMELFLARTADMESMWMVEPAATINRALFTRRCVRTVAVELAFPTTPGVVGPVNGSSGGCNLAAVKIAFNFAGVAAGPKAFFNGVADSVGCVLSRLLCETQYAMQKVMNGILVMERPML